MPLHPRLRHAAVAAVLLPAALAAAAPASASVTSSTISAPVNGVVTEFNNDLASASTAPDNLLTVSGRTDSGSTTADTVDIGCQYGNGGSPSWKSLQVNVAVAADHSFTTTISKRAGDSYPCFVKAIPSATANKSTADLSAFSGARVIGGYATTNTRTVAPNAGALYDYYFERSQEKGYMDYDSAGSCGIDDASVFTGTTQSAEIFYCNDYFSRNYSDQRNGVEVDGKRAYLPDDISASTTVPAVPALRVSHTVDPVTGDMTITESDDVSVCLVADADPTQPCTSLTSSGLRLDRVIHQDHAGLQSTIADSWVSVDGQPHQLDVIEQEDLHGSNPTVKAGWESPSYVERADGDLISAPPAGVPATLYVDGDKDAPDNDPVYIQGAITYASQPTAFRFTSHNTFFARYLKTVPAGGAISITQVYSQSLDRPGAGVLAAEAENRLTPPAPLAAPAAQLPSPTVITKTVTVQVPTPQCVVPTLRGLSLSKAKAALAKAKCATGKVSKRPTSRKSRVGRVLSTSKQVGAGYKVGTAVELVVGKKPKAKKK